MIDPLRKIHKRIYLLPDGSTRDVFGEDHWKYSGAFLEVLECGHSRAPLIARRTGSYTYPDSRRCVKCAQQFPVDILITKEVL